MILAALAVFCLSASFHLWLEFQMETPLSSDGYYHIKIAQLYGTGECSIVGGDFPWARFSNYNHFRHDWQLLYHLLLIPFTWFGLTVGAKLSTVFFAALLLTTFYVLLKIHRVPWAWFFTVVVALASPSLIWRLHLARPTTLYMAVLLILAHLLATRRSWAVLATTLAAMLLYNVPHSLVAVAGVGFGVTTVIERRLVWKPFVAMLAGIALGIILHPGFWHWEGSFFGGQHATFELWRQIQGSVSTSALGNWLTIGGERVNMRLGRELLPLSGAGIRNEFILPLALILGSFLLYGLRRRKPLAPLAQVSLVLAGVYFYLFLGSMRFMEYWVPFAVLGCGIALRDTLAELPILGGDPEAVRARFHQPGPLDYVLEVGAGLCLLIQLASLLVRSSAGIADWTFWAPAILAAACLLLRALLTQLAEGLPQARGLDTFRIGLGIFVFLVVLGGLGAGMASNARTGFAMVTNTSDHSGHRYQAAMEWLVENSEAGDLVFHSDWDDFAPMFFFNHKNHYLVGFDPYFFYMYDPERYLLWKKICKGKLQPTEVHQAISLSFGARFVFATHETNWRDFVLQLGRSSYFEIAFRDEFCTVYRVH